MNNSLKTLKRIHQRQSVPPINNDHLEKPFEANSINHFNPTNGCCGFLLFKVLGVKHILLDLNLVIIIINMTYIYALSCIKTLWIK